MIVSSVNFRQNGNIDCGPEARLIKYHEKNVLIYLDVGQTVLSQRTLFIFYKRKIM